MGVGRGVKKVSHVAEDEGVEDVEEGDEEQVTQMTTTINRAARVRRSLTSLSLPSQQPVLKTPHQIKRRLMMMI
uniref:Uncharacterized protein n=1 Tax=Ciona savignyi TaxID=51511 RepID=H2YNK2_CIOSA